MDPITAITSTLASIKTATDIAKLLKDVNLSGNFNFKAPAVE